MKNIEKNWNTLTNTITVQFIQSKFTHFIYKIQSYSMLMLMTIQKSCSVKRLKLKISINVEILWSLICCKCAFSVVVVVDISLSYFVRLLSPAARSNAISTFQWSNFLNADENSHCINNNWFFGLDLYKLWEENSRKKKAICKYCSVLTINITINVHHSVYFNHLNFPAYFRATWTNNNNQNNNDESNILLWTSSRLICLFINQNSLNKQCTPIQNFNRSHFTLNFLFCLFPFVPRYCPLFQRMTIWFIVH